MSNFCYFKAAKIQAPRFPVQRHLEGSSFNFTCGWLFKNTNFQTPPLETLTQKTQGGAQESVVFQSIPNKAKFNGKKNY